MPSTAETVLLTGARGVGKTTACLRLRARALGAGISCGGLVTLPITDLRGRRLGLDLLDAESGERRRLASCLEELDGPRIGPYSMRCATVDWGVWCARRALAVADLVLLDEIGPLELDQEAGFAPLREDLSRAHGGAAVIVVRPGLMERLPSEWRLPRALRVEATIENRSGLAEALFRRLFPGTRSRFTA